MNAPNRFFSDDQAAKGLEHGDLSTPAQAADKKIGEVVEVQGRSCVCAFDEGVRSSFLDESQHDSQVVGQIGSFTKFKVGERFVFAVVRNLRSVGLASDQTIFGELDFIGELVPSAARSDGYMFRRGVTKYPMPGQKLLAATSKDMRVIFAPMGKAHVNIGYVYPTDTVKAAIDVDAVLSRHFAVLGSTGTGKSSVVSMILRKIVEQSNHGHVLIFDPHDEYATAFTDYGVRHDTANLSI
ncbi:MAG: ATP-binding protein, partial [Pseudomonadota bacterium]